MTGHATMNDLAPAARALRRLAGELHDLPAAIVAVEPVPTPDGARTGVCLSLHASVLPDAFGAFEQWRKALGIDPGQVGYRDLGTCSCLDMSTMYAGVPLHLIAYGPRSGE